MTAGQKLEVPYAGYLAAEETAVMKHGSIDGAVFAMTGGTLESMFGSRFRPAMSEAVYADAEGIRAERA